MSGGVVTFPPPVGREGDNDPCCPGLATSNRERKCTLGHRRRCGRELGVAPLSASGRRFGMAVDRTDRRHRAGWLHLGPLSRDRLGGGGAGGGGHPPALELMRPGLRG